MVLIEKGTDLTQSNDKSPEGYKQNFLRASKFSVLKLSEIVILWVYYTFPFGFSLIWHFWGITSTF